MNRFDLSEINVAFPKNRLLIYEYLLKEYKKDSLIVCYEGSVYGTCRNFCNILGDTIYFLTELITQKPKKTWAINDAYWWKPSNRNRRIKALEQAIIEVKLLIN